MAGDRHRVLLITEDRHTAAAVRRSLEREHEVHVVDDAKAALNAHLRLVPHVAILDLDSPRLGGLRLLAAMRMQTRAPVLVLASADRLPDFVHSVEARAVDYMIKPVFEDELRARIVTTQMRETESERRSRVAIGDLLIDPTDRSVRYRQRTVDLTPREFDVMHVLARNAGRVVSKEQLFKRAWEAPLFGDANLIEQHVSGLRRKLRHLGADDLIDTVRGIGYVLRPQPADRNAASS